MICGIWILLDGGSGRLCLRAANLWPERGRCSFQCLGNSLLPVRFVVDVVVAWVAVTPARNAVVASRKALTVQFEALAVAAVAPSEVFRWLLQALLLLVHA